MKTTNKKARFLHQESREYRGLPRVRDYKTRASRIERRAVKQRLNESSEGVAQCSWEACR
jgi:hypothetical protein